MSFEVIPQNLIISNVTIDHITPNFYAESVNLQGRSRDRGIHRWAGSFDITIADELDKRKFEAFLLKVRGRLNPFYMSFGGRFSSPGVSGVLALASAASVGDTSIVLKAFSGTVNEGDVFTLPNDDKVYMFMETKNGSGPINIYPALRQSQVVDGVITVNDVRPLIRLDKDVQTVNYEDTGAIHTATFKWKEALM